MKAERENNKMVLKILGSSSKGNCYVLTNGKHCLVIESGIKFREVERAIDYKISTLDGVIVSHNHNDHSKYVKEFIENMQPVYCSHGTAVSLGINTYRRCIQMQSETLYKIGNEETAEFSVMPFNVEHDAPEPFGFLIYHKDCGNVLFLTDTYYSQYTFADVENIIVECNHDKELLKASLLNTKLQERIAHTHLSLATCKELLQANDLSKVRNIVLIHLSLLNSDSELFKTEIEKLTNKKVTIADKGVEIDFSRDISK